MSPLQWLAFDTSTEVLSIGVAAKGHTDVRTLAGGAQSSATLIPTAMDMLAQADIGLPRLQAIVFGRGPGSFTGLRTACAVAQGLAFGAELPVLGIETLKALAPPVRSQDPHATRVLAVLDARMQQVYAAAYEWRDNDWQTVRAPGLYDPIDLRLPPDWADDAQVWVAGNALDALGESPGVLRSPDGSARHTLALLPDAPSLLQLAPAAWARGEAVPAADLQPLYLRDKVALTTVEREAIKVRTAAAAASEVST